MLSDTPMVSAPRQASIGIAVIKIVVGRAPGPVIRILEVNELFRDEHVLTVTSSPDEAAGELRRWLHEMTVMPDARPR